MCISDLSFCFPFFTFCLWEGAEWLLLFFCIIANHLYCGYDMRSLKAYTFQSIVTNSQSYRFNRLENILKKWTAARWLYVYNCILQVIYITCIRCKLHIRCKLQVSKSYFQHQHWLSKERQDWSVFPLEKGMEDLVVEFLCFSYYLIKIIKMRKISILQSNAVFL